MATSGILLTTIASVRVLFYQRLLLEDININSFINNYNDQENMISSWKHNVPVIQVRFLQNAVQVLLV